MGDLDIETIEWLNTLKLGNKLSYLSDFENGYYMGVIFQRMNLSKGKKFKNTNDMACKFQNFKNIRDLLYQNFKVDFPIQNILYNIDNLLRTIRDSIKRYNKDKKEATLRRIETFSESKIQPNEQKMFASRQKDILFSSKMNQTTKLPKKIQDIQQKLEKYRQIKTKHQLIALEDRKKEIEENRRLVQEHRLFEMNKIRTNHQFMREHERKVYDVWMKTEQIKKTRIEKDNNLKSFMEEKKNKFYQSLRQEEINTFEEGLQAFQINCIRQGVQLDHDPDKLPSKTEQNFNKQVVLERIKDNIKSHDKERKDRIKRENKKNVDAREANLKAEKLWNENNLIQKYAKTFNDNIKQCEELTKKKNRENAEKKIIVEKTKNKKYAELPQPQIDQEQRNAEFRQRMMKYRDQEISRLQKKEKELKCLGSNALEALIHIVIENQQAYFKNKGFDYFEWKKIEKEFLKYQRKEKQQSGEVYVDKSFDLKVENYVKQTGEWSIKQKQGETKFKVSEVFEKIIDKAYPQSQFPPKNDIPLYMPLKIVFSGNSLSGKSTLAQKISNKYGIMIINPQSIINEAFQLNKEPVVEDPKKKKDPKKPEEENPEKIALKEWGEKLMKKLDDPSKATIEHFVQAIEFKLRFNFTNKSEEQILEEYETARNQEVQRYSKALKDFEEAQKKGKKDSKKGGESDEPPSEKKYFYTKGFIIDGVELTLEDIKCVEKKLNGFISFEERINETGQSLKSQLSSIIPIPKSVKDNRLQKGTFDLFFHLNVNAQTLESRQGSEKVNIEEKDWKSVQQYYSSFGEEKTKTSAYQSVDNNATVEECLEILSAKIETHLNSKYEDIENFRNKKSEPAIKQIEQNQQQTKQIPQHQEEHPKSGETVKQQKTIKQDVINKEEISKQIVNKPLQDQISQIKGLSQQKSYRLMTRVEQFYKKYQNTISLCFHNYDQLRSDFSSNLMHLQQKFTSIINRPDDKAGKILTFQENYNKLLLEKKNIVKDAEASKHLISKLDQLNDGLWVSIQAKKNEAVAERTKVLNSTTLNSEVQKIIEVTKQLCENELTLFVQFIFFLYNISNILKGRTDQIPAEYLVLGIPPNLQPIKSIEQSEFVSDRLDYYIQQTKTCLKELPEWLKKKEKKYSITKSNLIDSILSDFIDKQTQVIEQRLRQIQKKTKEKYLEYFGFFRVLTNKMDDWIIQGIKHENQFVYDIYKTLKNSILEAKKSGVKDLFVKDITDLLHPLSGLPPLQFPVVEVTEPSKFKILSFLIFMQEIRCLATGDKIPFKVFKSYIEKRKKSKWLTEEFLSLELDIMQQYLVTEEYCNYKEVALAMLLWKHKILLEDSINEYHKHLCGHSGVSVQENYTYLKEELTYGEFKIMPGITADQQEASILKAFIYEIFRQQFKNKLVVKDYIETLKLFSQLQVFRYGDTLMILHEAGDKHYESQE